MGNLLSIEFIEGQSATGKTTFIEQRCESESVSSPAYTKILCDPGDNASCSHIFFRSDSDSDPLSILDLSQGGISLAYFFKLIESLTSYSRPSQRLLVDRSPLSLFLYEYWWRRLFPMLKEIIFERAFTPEDPPGECIKKALLHHPPIRECLSYFGQAMLSIMVGMSNLATRQKKKIVVHLVFHDADDYEHHSLTTSRRQERGGIDKFSLDSVERGSLREAFFLYTAGESLLWEEMYKTYIGHEHLFAAGYFKMIRIPTDFRGLIAARNPFLLADGE